MIFCPRHVCVTRKEENNNLELFLSNSVNTSSYSLKPFYLKKIEWIAAQLH